MDTLQVRYGFEFCIVNRDVWLRSTVALLSNHLATVNNLVFSQQKSPYYKHRASQLPLYLIISQEVCVMCITAPERGSSLGIYNAT